MIINTILGAFSSYYLIQQLKSYEKMSQLSTAVISAIAVSVISALVIAYFRKKFNL